MKTKRANGEAKMKPIFEVWFKKVPIGLEGVPSWQSPDCRENSACPLDLCEKYLALLFPELAEAKIGDEIILQALPIEAETGVAIRTDGCTWIPLDKALSDKITNRFFNGAVGSFIMDSLGKQFATIVEFKVALKKD